MNMDTGKDLGLHLQAQLTHQASLYETDPQDGGVAVNLRHSSLSWKKQHQAFQSIEASVTQLGLMLANAASTRTCPAQDCPILIGNLRFAWRWCE